MLNYCKCLEPKKEIKSNMKRILGFQTIYLPLIWLYKKSRKPIKNRAYETVDAHNDAV